jgi:hypothetical protein
VGVFGYVYVPEYVILLLRVLLLEKRLTKSLFGFILVAAVKVLASFRRQYPMRAIAAIVQLRRVHVHS